MNVAHQDDYRNIVRLFREEEVLHHTFPLPSERNIHAVVRGVPVNFSDTEIKGELEQRGYSPHHIIRLKRSCGAPMPLVVVILPKIEKSQQVFNEHELLGLAIQVEVQKNSRLIGQCHRCQKTKYSYGSQRHPAMFSEQEIKEELEQRGYTPLHIIRLKRSGGAPMPLVVVILSKIEKSQQLFNEHELLGLTIIVEVQKNSRLIGQCHRCQRYGHAQSYCTAPNKCLKCASDHMTHLCPLTGQEERKCANCGGAHPANSPTNRFTPRRNLEVIAQRRSKSYTEAAVATSSAAPSIQPTLNTQNVDLAAVLRSIQ
ncbi:unnamed protein product [Acanthoscelides obtectus]|uniref:Pre-C2HC domain-containing protein n=1 Tax=Acanthoscelides obtectus TaxID=200917 RepID=A0A9P0LU23_ACAOB|nr:unnamed protein product [Acanthoscelides obtectus]CAK1668518.1 Nucleic-acid-binding protein from transposon X-element [Acanthoscelides obtectus]